jgi:hypothetical protein
VVAVDDIRKKGRNGLVCRAQLNAITSATGTMPARMRANKVMWNVRNDVHSFFWADVEALC